MSKVGYAGYGYAAPAVAKVGYSDASLVSSSYVSAPSVAYGAGYHKVVAAPAVAKTVSYAAPAVAYGGPGYAKVGYSDASLVSSSYVSQPAIAKTISYAAPAVAYGAPGIAKVASYSSAPLVSSAYVSSPAIANVNGLAYGAGYGKVLATQNIAPYGYSGHGYSGLGYSGHGYAKVAAAPVVTSTAYGHGSGYAAYGNGLRYASAVSPISTYSTVPAAVVKPLTQVVAKPIIAKQYEYYVSIYDTLV